MLCSILRSLAQQMTCIQSPTDRRARLSLASLSLLAISFLHFSAPAAARSGEIQRILFIGNSYTYFNNLPSILEQMANSARPGSVEAIMVVEGGATLKDLWDAGDALKIVRQGGWSYVVLQEQSALGDGPTDENGIPQISDPSTFYDYSRRFDSEIKGSGAKTVFYLTWARRDSPGNQSKLAAAYTSIAKERGGILVPAGLAWEAAIHEKPNQLLHQVDKSHPTPAGTYLTACVFYSVLFRKSPIGLPARFVGKPVDMKGHIFEAQSHDLLSSPAVAELVNLSPQDALFLQSIAWNVTRASSIQ